MSDFDWDRAKVTVIPPDATPEEVCRMLGITYEEYCWLSRTTPPRRVAQPTNAEIEAERQKLTQWNTNARGQSTSNARR